MWFIAETQLLVIVESPGMPLKGGYRISFVGDFVAIYPKSRRGKLSVTLPYLYNVYPNDIFNVRSSWFALL